MKRNLDMLQYMVEIQKKLPAFIMPKWVLFFGLVILLQVPCPNWIHAKLIPESLLKWSEQGADYAILVDKFAQKVFLYHRDDVSRPVKEYRCSTGENSGPKSRKNDRKTPEGIYFFTKSYVKRELSPIYGVKALPIDYPSPLDKVERKGGYGIWFHGTNESLKPRDTNGCIVLENGDIDELASYVKLHKTPVIITPGIEKVSPESLKQESRKLGEIIERWRDAWENKDISRYMSVYSPGFSARGMDWQRWKGYKSRLAKKYSKIEVEVDDLQLFKANNVVLAKFYQTYRTGNYESRGEKRLYLSKNSNQWKIITEFFVRHKSGGRISSRPRATALDEIKSFVNAWKKAWERKDLNAYIAFYDRNFRSQGFNLKAWKRHKAGLTRKYHSIKIGINQLKIVHDSRHNAEVRFRQHYQADSYQDLGIKKLFLEKRGKHWKIKKETWCLLPAKPAP